MLDLTSLAMFTFVMPTKFLDIEVSKILLLNPLGRFTMELSFD